MPDKAPSPTPAVPVPVTPPRVKEHEKPVFGIGGKPIRLQDPGDDPANGQTFGISVAPILINDYQGGAGNGFGINVKPYGVGTTGGTGPRYVTQYGPVIRKGNKQLDQKDGGHPTPPQGGLLGLPGMPGLVGVTGARLLPEYILPMRKGFEVDTRFKIRAPRTHSDMSPMPLGTITITAESTTESEQCDLVVPCDNRLIAANRGLGFASDYGTRVCDLGLSGEIDTKRAARLQTAFRVLRTPTGDFSLAGNRQNSLAWTIGLTGIGDELGGFVSDNRNSEAVHAHVSWRNGGPFDVGDGAGDYADKHQIGVTWDGQPINALHFSTGTLFNAPPSWAKDGPLTFANAGYDYTAKDGTAPQRVHLVWDPQEGYDFPRDGTRRMFGAWKWITYATVYEIKEPTGGRGPTTGGGDTPGGPTTGGGDGDPPPPPPGTGPTTPGDGGLVPYPGPSNPGEPGGGPLRGGTQTHYQQAGGSGAPSAYQAVGAAIKELLIGPTAARPQILGDGQVDYAHSAKLTGSQRLEFDKTAPASLVRTPFGKQENGQYARTQEPGVSRYPGGTISGGVFLHPPEVTILDDESGYAPDGVTVSDVAEVYGPGVATAWGTIDPAIGEIDDGVRMIRNSSGSVAVEALVAGVWTRVATWSGDGLRVKSGASAIIESGASASVLAGGSVVLGEGVNVQLGTGTGTKFGTGSTQRIGFYGATPVAQGSSIADATDAPSAITQLNAALAWLRSSGQIAP